MIMRSFRGRGHVFDDVAKLNEMLNRRMMGEGVAKLGAMYGVDHSTIIYHCKRSGMQFPGKHDNIVVSSGIIAISIGGMGIRRPIQSTQPDLIDFDGDRINPGKTYAEYVAEDIKRRKKKIFINGKEI